MRTLDTIFWILAALAGGYLLGKWIHSPTPQQAGSSETATHTGEVLAPEALSTRLHDLESTFSPFGSNAAHPSALAGHAQFQEAVKRLASPDVPLDTVLQYVEGANWGLASAALAALKERADRSEAIERVQAHCAHLSAWSMYFALDFLAETESRVPVGAPLVGAKDWWADNSFMPLMFRDYFKRRAALGDAATFGSTLDASFASPWSTIRAFLKRVPHPFATELAQELEPMTERELLEGLDMDASPPAAKADTSVLSSIGRFWSDQREVELLVEPEDWREGLAVAEATLAQKPLRSLLVAGEPYVGKTSFLRLLAERVAPMGWSVFEAGGADLMAGQIYIGQLEGRIRDAVQELDAGKKRIWYIPDIVQLARSGTHQGQSASILDQILPAVTAGRLVIWCEATPTSAARLIQMRPSLRAVLEALELEAQSTESTLALARGLIKQLKEKANIHFRPDCADVALDTARQYLGTAGLPGTALIMLKRTAVRAERSGGEITPRQVLESLSQLSGLPVSILDTKERIDLQTIRDFFRARVIGQDEAVKTIVERIAMLKAGLNDPGKPIGVFLFAGPTGTGKTELAKAVSEYLFGSVERLIRLDMSEFQTPDSIGKILGNPSAPADTDSLVNRVRKQPFSVLLLDEFEKSNHNIWDLFLQVFDDGRLSDAAGQVVDFRHCLIILTSNLGATAHRTLGLGFSPQADLFTSEQIMRAISQTYRPEFQNRLDKVIVFQPLTRELMRGILRKELSALLDRRGFRDRAWAVEWESSALEFLLEQGFSPEMGARPLKRAIDQHVVAPLAAIIVEKRFPEGDQFLFVRSDGQAIQAEFVDPDGDGAAADVRGAEQAVPPAALAPMILTPAGTQAEFQALEAELVRIEQTLASAEWEDLKVKLSADMVAPDFWNRPDRFDTLARIALLDRVKAATETAESLRTRLARGARPPRPYSPELVGRLALQLHLVKEGITDVFDNEPIELAFVAEPVFDTSGDKAAALDWCRKLTAMYRGWGDKRRMHVSELPGAKDDMPVLLVNGFGAHRVLAREAGLHVFEATEGDDRVTARVRLAVVPLGDVPPHKAPRLIARALDAAARSNTIVRRYRGEPPLVRNADGKWRTGRLDLVLGGDFDLLDAGQR
jgi:ATP-dependent Clp protease ATP-binding subunit ClpC